MSSRLSFIHFSFIHFSPFVLSLVKFSFVDLCVCTPASVQLSDHVVTLLCSVALRNGRSPYRLCQQNIRGYCVTRLTLLVLCATQYFIEYYIELVGQKYLRHNNTAVFSSVSLGHTA